MTSVRHSLLAGVPEHGAEGKSGSEDRAGAPGDTLTPCGATHSRTCSCVALQGRAPHTKTPEGEKKTGDELSAPRCYPPASRRRRSSRFSPSPCFPVLSPFFCSIRHRSRPAWAWGGGGWMRRHGVKRECLSARGRQSKREGEMWLRLHPPSAHS